MGFGADLLKNEVIRAWKLPTRAKNSENPNPHSSNIIYLLPVYGLRNKNCGSNRSTTDLFTDTQTDGKYWLLGLFNALDRQSFW